MKTFLFMVLCLSLFFVPSASAGVTVFNMFTSPANSLTLSSGMPDMWTLSYELAPREYVVGATITYVDVLATNYTEDDRLFTNLVDIPEPGSENVGVHNPDAEQFGYFDECFEWHEGFEGNPATYTYDLGDPQIDLLGELESFMQNPEFAVGSNPLGYFTVNNVIFTLTTEIAPIPAPGAVFLASTGIGIVGYLRRRKML